MARYHTLLGLGLASSMMLAGSAFAATTQHAASATAARPAAHASTKLAAVNTKAKSRTASAATHQRLVKVRLSNGKMVTYDCSLAGNKTKQACKG